MEKHVTILLVTVHATDFMLTLISAALALGTDNVPGTYCVLFETGGLAKIYYGDCLQVDKSVSV